MKIANLVFWGIFSSISGFKLEDPSEPGVIWGDYVDPVQMIYVDENNDRGRIKLTLITEVSFTIDSYALVNPTLQSLIDLQIEYIDNQFYLTANLLNYETLKEEHFLTGFYVDIIQDGDILTRQTLSVNIQNLDDESPFFLAMTTCIMEEETFIDVETSTCIFYVNDRDGWLNLMNFSRFTETQGGESDLFEFKYSSPPDETLTQQADVSLVLKPGQKLDDETTPFYSFYVTARDNGGHGTVPLGSTPVMVQVKDMPDPPPG